MRRFAPASRPTPAAAMARRPNGESGQVLVLALLVIVLLTVAVALVAQAFEIESRQLRWEIGEIRLTALTDAVLAETLAQLDRERSFPGVREKELAEGRVESSVSVLGPSLRRVVARAEYAGRERTIEAFVELRPAAPWVKRVAEWRRIPKAVPATP